jgi:microsomal dipeptidase-like Zn-dependent dipeptidase
VDGRLVATMAIVRSNADQERDYIAMFEPFATDRLKAWPEGTPLPLGRADRGGGRARRRHRPRAAQRLPGARLVPGDPPVTLAEHAAAHLRHIAGIAGWDLVEIGSDVDAGHGRAETPRELDSVADWPRIADVVPVQSRAGVLGGNWLRFLRAALPAE